jgi:hypothetical protein
MNMRMYALAPTDRTMMLRDAPTSIPELSRIAAGPGASRFRRQARSTVTASRCEKRPDCRPRLHECADVRARAASLTNPSASHRLNYGFAPRMNVQTLVNAAHVKSDGVDADGQTIGAGLVTMALRQKPEHLQFAL